MRMTRSSPRRSPRPRSPRPRSPRPRSPRPRSPRPKSPRKRSPVRRPASPRRRSGDRGGSRRGPRSPPPRLGFGGNNGMGGGGMGGGRKRKRRRRKKGRGRGGGGMGGGGGMDGGPPMSGGNRQPIASMRMRMDDYRPPRAGRLLRDPKEDGVVGAVGGERGPIEQVVVRARREATTRTKDTFWTKKLLDAEATQPNRWAHSGFKELYRDELGYSDIGEGSGEDKGGGERASSHPRDPRDPSGIVPRKVGASPSRPRSPRDPRRRTRSRSPHTSRISPRRSPIRTVQRSPRGSPRPSPKPGARSKRQRGSHSPSRSRGRKRSYSSSYSRSSSSSSGSSYSRSYSSYSRSSSGSSSSSFTSSSSSSSGSRRRRSYSPSRRRRSYSSSPHRGRVGRRQPPTLPQQVRIKQVSHHQETTKKLVTKTVSNVIKTKTRAGPKIQKLKTKIKMKDGERVVPVPVAVRRKPPRSPAPLPVTAFYDGAAGVPVEEPSDFRGPETPPRPLPEGRHLLDPHHYKVVPPDHPDYHQPPPIPRESPRSEGEDTDSDSSSDDDDGPRRMTLSERFGKLAQLSSQRQEYEGVRMKIVREGGQDKKVYLEGGRLQSRSPSPGSRSRSNHPAHERWLQEHQTEYREYQERYGEIRQWDPHRDLPRELPANWDDVHVRYRYYKESGYFGDRSITLDDYLKWEQWWYRYRDWLEKYGGAQEVEERDWPYRASNYEYDQRGSGASASQGGGGGRWVRREASREADDRKRRRY